MGNEKVNAIYEANLSKRLAKPSSGEDR